MDTSEEATPGPSLGRRSKTPEAGASHNSPWSRAMTAEEATWMKTREQDSNDIPSEAPTPAPTEPPELSAPESVGTPATKTTHIDAEDEDVRIAIMALGAMKHLDGRRRTATDDSSGGSLTEDEAAFRPQKHQGSSGSGTLPRLPEPVQNRKRDGSNASLTGNSSIVSTSSVASTAISSPSSTPATEWTAASVSTPCSVTSSAQHAEGSTSTGGSQGMSRAATLADLPSDFEFPAIIQDEDGNEVEVDKEMMSDADFLARVSHLPIVRGTLRAYEMGKQRSKIVKYGGDLVESSVKAISRPVVGRLGASLGERGKEQLDDFACRQLDRLYPTSPGSASVSKEERQQLMADLDERERTEWAHMDAEERSKRRRAYWALHMEEQERQNVVSELRQRKNAATAANANRSEEAISPSGSESTQVAPRQRLSASSSSPNTAGSTAQTPSEAGRALVEQATKTGSGSRWGSILVEAGATAGGLSAAMSEESMKSLKYCLQWLQYATAHIEHQITVLRDLIVKLNHGELELTSPAAQNLGQIKGDVVNTIRSVVDVVGKYAGGALPEPARVSVKAFILSLPARWATVNRAPAVANASTFGGSPASPSFSPAHLGGQPSTPTPSSGGGSMSAAATAQAANRVLTLAVESLDILRSVTVVVGESLDRADLWVERLRMLGIQRKRQHEQEAIGGPNSHGSGTGRLEAPPPHWESARGLASSYRRGSIGAGSDVSMGTSASTKRRRMRGEADESHVSHDDEYRPHHHSQLAGSPMSGGNTMSTSVSFGRGHGGGGSNGLAGNGAGGGPGAAASRRRRGAAMAPQRSGGV